MKDFTKKHYDVIIIGGGITGAGTARDCAMRGMKVLLVEKDDLTNGATGRNHGLLHSGARYAVTDQASATECIKENFILRKVARHCVEETDGLFITLPEDDLTYQATFVEACQKAGIRADIIDPEEARRIEPSVNPDLIGAVRIPDASVDPFRLTVANVLDARNHGADILTYHEVTDLLVEQDKVIGVALRNNLTGETYDVHGSLTINAAGIWGHLVAKQAGITINMFPAKGCRKPANADILVPDDAVCVIGTTSDRVPFDTIDDLKITKEEVDLLIKEGEKLAPSLATTRILRAYAGVRPLVAADNDPSGRNISRGIVCLDHATRDGMEGFITITGGKMMTYRLMAEEATNLACKKLHIDKPCETATTPLPGSEAMIADSHGKIYSTSVNAAEGRHGLFAKDLKLDTVDDSALICECEEVSVAEVKFAIEKLHIHNLLNLRRRTRVGMGTCQGELCTCRAANFICEKNVKKSEKDLLEFVDERWKGMRPVAWGQSLSEAQLSAHIYQDLCGLDKLKASLEEKS